MVLPMYGVNRFEEALHNEPTVVMVFLCNMLIAQLTHESDTS